MSVRHLTSTCCRHKPWNGLSYLAADEGSRESVDAKCKSLTASWVRERHVTSQDIEVCEFYETLEAAGAEAVLEPGVYTLQVRRHRDERRGCMFTGGDDLRGSCPAAGHAGVGQEEEVVSLLPSQAHDHHRQRGRIQLPIHAGPQGEIPSCHASSIY